MVDFLIIGGQRCGTSSFYHNLIKHPDIGGCSTKEVRYFNMREFDDVLYEDFFTRKGLKGEATPYYMFVPHIAEKVKNLYPNVKLIALLRNPIDRAYSNYIRRGEESFEDALAKEEERVKEEKEEIFRNKNYRLSVYDSNFLKYSYVGRGKYAEQLSRWLNVFPREQFKIIKSENFYNNMAKVLNETASFLGANRFDFNGVGLEHSNKTNYLEQMNPETRKKLQKLFNPYNEELYKLVGIKWDEDSYC